MAQMSHPIKRFFTIRCLAVPYVHIFGLLRIPFLCCGPSLVHQALTKRTHNKTTTKQNNHPHPPPKKKNKKKKNKKKTTTTTKKNNKKNSNKQITKTDKTQQTNVALATARAYTIYVTNVSVFLLFLFIVSSVWGKMVLKPCLGCRGFALIRLFFGDSLPCGPLCAHIRFAQNSFFVLRTKSSASSTNQKNP